MAGAGAPFRRCCCFLALAASLVCYAEALAWSQVQGLLKLQKLLESPSATANWYDFTNFCYLPPSALLNITCAGDTVTYLRIVGDKVGATVREKLDQSSQGSSLGAAKSLSSSFSINTLADTLLFFPDLLGVELVSVGMWGNLPDELGQMRNLQIFNASSNLFTGAIPRSFANLAGLQALALDDNGLTGPLPYWLSSVPTISTLSLAGNALSGELNDSISYFWNLKTLSLSNNLLGGAIPGSITSLQNLRLLALAQNQFTGPIPNLDALTNLETLNVCGNSLAAGFPTLGMQVVTVRMGQNQLTGPIPAFLKDFAALQTLDVSANALAGPLPPFLFALPSIASLSLARNRLSGSLPANLSLSKSLAFVDVSANFISGAPPLLFLSPPKNVTLFFQSNCMSTSKQKQGSHYYCTVTAAKLGVGKFRHNHRLAIIVAAVGGGVGVAVAVCALLFLFVNKYYCGGDRDSVAAPDDGNHSVGSIGIPSELLFNARYLSQSKRLGVLPQPQNRMFTIEELKAATNNFSPGSFVGEGRHGKVFKGQLEDKAYVAVKWLAFKSKDDMNEYKTQAEVLSKLRYRHLVSVLGYCTEEMTTTVGDEDHTSFCLFIVSEFVDNGDLRSHLRRHRGKEALNWSQRLAAVIGAGRGIHYLHTGVVPPIFYNNLKITNILLDANMVAQVSDFGLPVRRVSFSMDVVVAESKSGGPRLMHEESLRRRERRDKQDVYDYGAILLEIVLGRPPTIKNPFPQKRSEIERLTKEKGPSMELIDKDIVGTCGAESLATVLEIAGKCMVDDPLRRPSMEDVLWNLQYAVQVHASIDDVADENDLRREEFQKAPTGSADKKRGSGYYDNRVSDEDWKAGPSASRDFLR